MLKFMKKIPGISFKLIGINTFIQIIGKVINVLLGFITVSLLTRYLGTGGYGSFTITFTYISFFSIFADFGLQLLVIRELSHKQELEDIIYGTYLGLKLFLVCLSVIFPLLFLGILPYSLMEKWGIVIAAVAVGFSSFSGFGSTIFQYKTRLDYLTYADIFTKIITVLCIFLFVFLKFNFYFIVGSVLIGNILGLLLQILFIKKLQGFSFKFNYIYAKKLIYRTIPIGATLLFSITYFKLDTLMLSIFRDSTQVGIYSLAYKILENILVLWSFYMASTYPLLTKYYHQKKTKEYLNLVKVSLGTLVISSIIIMIFTFSLAQWVITILGGHAFYSSVLPLRILVFSVPFFFLNNFFYFYNLTMSRNYILVSGLIFSLLTNALLNILVIPHYGYVGASITTVVTEILLTLFYCYMKYGIKHKYSNE